MAAAAAVGAPSYPPPGTTAGDRNKSLCHCFIELGWVNNTTVLVTDTFSVSQYAGAVSLMQSLVRHHRVGRSCHPLRVMIAEVVLRDETALAGLVTDADGGQGEAKTDHSIRHVVLRRPQIMIYEVSL